jgi:predicted dinucleotide-utilizing enzyme
MNRKPIRFDDLTAEQMKGLLKHQDLFINVLVGGFTDLLAKLDAEAMSPANVAEISGFHVGLNGCIAMSNDEIDQIVASTHQRVSEKLQ